MSNESDGNVIINQPRLTEQAERDATINSPEMKVKRGNGNSLSGKKPT